MDEDPDDDWEYRPVTGLFVHQSSDVWKINFDDGTELGVTTNHPIYSISKDDWQLAGQLEIGEKVLTLNGDATVVSKDAKLALQPVYNLEVKDLHNFLVGESGVVVHNSCWNLLKDIFNIFGINFTDAKKITGKKWTHALDGDEPLLKEIEFTEEIGEHLQKRIALAPKGADGFDAISEEGKVLSYKVMEGQSVASNLSKLKDNLSEAISSYRALPQHAELKVDIWVKGDHLAKDAAKANWNLIKDTNVPYTSNKDIIGRIFYKGPDGIIEFD